jgi:hypothetical protein
LAHGKHFFHHQMLPSATTVSLRVIFAVRKDQARGTDNFFAVRFTMAHGKVFFKN